MTELPLPEPDLEGIDHEVWGQNVASDCWFAEKMHSHALAYHANQMRNLREAQGLSEERIWEMVRKTDAQALHGDNRRDCETRFAHAIADPLLARIAELEQESQRHIQWAKDAERAVDSLRAQLAEAQKNLALIRGLPNTTPKE
jgi:phage shock protein A